MFDRRFWMLTGLYLVLSLAALPLALGWVPPNSWFGYGPPGARLDPAKWYALNALFGGLMMAAMAVCATLNLLLHWLGTPLMVRYAGWINAAMILLAFWLISLSLWQNPPY